jgi:AraC-like DNA-binding protein
MEWERIALVAEFRPRELAKQCGVSLRTLQRLFRSRYQMSLSEWLRDVRMRQAYIRLRDGQRIKEVAYGLGFKQLSHFSREFKKEFGISPSMFRQSTFGPVFSGGIPLASVTQESIAEVAVSSGSSASFQSTVWNVGPNASYAGLFETCSASGMGAVGLLDNRSAFVPCARASG